MTIKITKIVKYKWNNITLLLCYTKITFTISWTSVFTSQMTMISYFIRNNLFLAKWTNVIIIKTFNLFCHSDVFLSIFKIDSLFIF